MACALGWVGLELHGLREDLAKPADEDPAMTAEADGSESRGCVDAVRQRVKDVAPKIAAAPLEITASR